MKISNRFKIEYDEKKRHSYDNLNFITNNNNVVFNKKKIYKSNSQSHLNLINQKYLNKMKQSIIKQNNKINLEIPYNDENDENKEQLEHYFINTDNGNEIIELPIIYLNDKDNEICINEICINENNLYNDKYGIYMDMDMDTEIIVQDKIL